MRFPFLFYVLDADHQPHPVDDFKEWAKAFEHSDRQVNETTIGEVLVSTVFLGIDHAHGDGPPQLFETMIFNGAEDGYCRRCSTWAEALALHDTALQRVLQCP